MINQGDLDGITKLSRSRIRRIKKGTFRANRLKGPTTFHEFYDEPSSPREISFRCHSKSEGERCTRRIGELVLDHERKLKRKKERDNFITHSRMRSPKRAKKKYREGARRGIRLYVYVYVCVRA